MTGKFITFEGIDGCGKSTISAEAIRLLEELGLRAYHTMEPSESWLGQAVRRSYDEEICPFTEVFLFLADRATHTLEIKKKLEEGHVVISDRYSDSSTAYQGALLEKSLAEQDIDSVDWISGMNATVMHTPDLTLLLDIAPEVSLKRAEDRGELSKFEKKDYLERVRANYLRIAEAEKRMKVIDANRPVEEVLAEAMKAIEEVL